jgi:hypothetical protein
MPLEPKRLKPRGDAPMDGVALLTQWANFQFSDDEGLFEPPTADNGLNPLCFRLSPTQLPPRTLTAVDPAQLPLL